MAKSWKLPLWFTYGSCLRLQTASTSHWHLKYHWTCQVVRCQWQSSQLAQQSRPTAELSHLGPHSKLPVFQVTQETAVLKSKWGTCFLQSPNRSMLWFIPRCHPKGRCAISGAFGSGSLEHDNDQYISSLMSLQLMLFERWSMVTGRGNGSLGVWPARVYFLRHPGSLSLLSLPHQKQPSSHAPLSYCHSTLPWSLLTLDWNFYKLWAKISLANLVVGVGYLFCFCDEKITKINFAITELGSDMWLRSLLDLFWRESLERFGDAGWKSIPEDGEWSLIGDSGQNSED